MEASASDLTTEEGEGQRDLLVKVSPPIHIKVVLPPSMLSSSPSSPSSKSTSELLESFMSSWTRLVGDPILSKWIVVVLAISITLNGYLLKGIAAGVVGGRIAESLGVGFGEVGIKGAVRFEGDADADSEVDGEEEREEERKLVVTRPGTDIDVKPKAPLSAEMVRNLASFKMEDVDRKLQTARRLMIKPKAVVSAVLPVDQPPSTISTTFTLSSSSTTIVAQPTSSSSSSSSPSDESPTSASRDNIEPIRTLDACIDIFENGPRPLSESLALLNDEEIIMLAQKGKVAAYALEKVLGSTKLERAVRIRRALICMFFFVRWIRIRTHLLQLVPRTPNPWNLPISHWPTTTTHASLAHAAKTLSDISLSH